MKMQEGKDEEEAIQDFGDFNELVDEILDAYKINVEEMKQTSEQEDRSLNFVLENCKRIVCSLFSMDLGKILSFLFEIFVVLVLLLLLRIPFNLISILGSGLLNGVLGYDIGKLLIKPWEVLVNVIYILVFVSTLMKALKKRIEKYQGESIKELKFSNFNLHVLNEGNWKELLSVKRSFFLCMIILLSFAFYSLSFIVNWSAIYNTSILLFLMIFSGTSLIFMLFIYISYKCLWKRKV